MDAEPAFETQRLGWLDDVTRTALGVLVGGGGFLMLATAWWRGGPQELQGLASVLLGLVGTVVGYYFGSRGIGRAEAQAVMSLRARDEMERIVEETHRRVQQAGDGAENEAATRRLRLLAEEYEVLMEQARRDERLIQRMQRLMRGGDEDAGGKTRGLR